MTPFEQVVAYETLLRGFDKVEENNGCAGFDGQTIEDFALNLEGNLAAIRSRVLSSQFRPAPLLRVYEDKKDGGKRPLSIPTVGDRVLHTAIALVITPVLDPDFADFSYAYRQGRSVDQAVRRILALRDAGYLWVVDADIHRYFDEIPHRKLLSALGGRIDDRKLQGLIRRRRHRPQLKPHRAKSLRPKDVTQPPALNQPSVAIRFCGRFIWSLKAANWVGKTSGS